MPNKKTTQKRSKKSIKLVAKTVKKTTRKKVSAVKKVVKKVTKKTAKKTADKKAATLKTLVCANETECFWTNDGQILNDLVALRDAFKTMDELVFNYHVEKERNDFADWVEHVLQDSGCAEALRKSRKPHTARSVVVRHLRVYNTAV